MGTYRGQMIADAVFGELRSRGRSIDWLAARSGLDSAALASVLEGGADLTMVDLAAIAAALDLPVAALVPPTSGRPD